MFIRFKQGLSLFRNTITSYIIPTDYSNGEGFAVVSAVDLMIQLEDYIRTFDSMIRFVHSKIPFDDSIRRFHTTIPFEEFFLRFDLMIRFVDFHSKNSFEDSIR